MSRRKRNNPKLRKVSQAVVERVRWMTETWRLTLQGYGIQDFTRLAGVDYNSAVTPSGNIKIAKGSLTCAICEWVEQTPGWQDQWRDVCLSRIPKSAFLQGKVGKKPFVPTLYWLFADYQNGKGKGLDRVLAGWYDDGKKAPRAFTSEEDYML